MEIPDKYRVRDPLCIGISRLSPCKVFATFKVMLKM